MNREGRSDGWIGRRNRLERKLHEVRACVLKEMRQLGCEKNKKSRKESEKIK